MLCERQIASGMSRNVFAHRYDQTIVIKHEFGAHFQNVVEWELWQQLREDKELKPWFAPCLHISGYGQWLIQRRTFPIEQRALPKKVPALFTDLKIENWGWLNGHPVCHDYGTMLCRLIGTASRRMRKADWWSERS